MNDKRIKVIAIDLDGTLCKEVCWTPEEVLNAKPVKKMIEWTNKVYCSNFIVIYTARRDELIPNTLKWLRKHDIKFCAISNNKMGADIYIDDKMKHPKEVK